MVAPQVLVRFIKFLSVGVLNTLFGYGIFALFLFLGLHYSLALLFGTVLGVVFNFFTTGRIVFQNNNNLLIFKFVGVYIIIYFLNLLFLTIFDMNHFNLYIGGLLLLAPMAILSFLLNQTLVFNRRLSR